MKFVNQTTVIAFGLGVVATLAWMKWGMKFTVPASTTTTTTAPAANAAAVSGQ